MFKAQSIILAQLRTRTALIRSASHSSCWNHRKAAMRTVMTRSFASSSNPEQVMVSQTKAPLEAPSAPQKEQEKLTELCGDIDDDDDDMEQEEMFVDAHESFEHDVQEWGGPRRGGRLPEPTRFGDWERKGRCTDF